VGLGELTRLREVVEVEGEALEQGAVQPAQAPEGDELVVACLASGY
jgi:hypothetical protein